jgi:hypothetical protein
VRGARAAVQQEKLDAGIVANRFVQTLNVPPGVCIGIIFTPPVRTPASVVSK